MNFSPKIASYFRFFSSLGGKNEIFLLFWENFHSINILDESEKKFPIF